MKVGTMMAILLAPAALLAQVSGEGRTAGKAGEETEKVETSEKVGKVEKAAKGEKRLSAQTQKNLEKAMQGEALAHAKYLLYANQARENNREDLADLYESIARTEDEEHLKEQAKLAGTVGSDDANLRDAIKGETHESETMYPEMAREARKAGDTEAAKQFEELARDEKKHRERFEKYLKELPRREAAR